MTRTIIEWLENSDPWVRYLLYKDILNYSPDNKQLISAHNDIIKDNRIIMLMDELKQWPGYTLKNHKDSNHLIHKLTFLADIGLDNTFSKIEYISEIIFKHFSAEKIPEINLYIPKHHGGTGEPLNTWTICDGPLILYALKKFGYGEVDKIISGTNYIISLGSNNGWSCHASSKLNKFRGPGQKGEACPYSNLLSLKLASQYEDLHRHPNTLAAIRILFNHWKERGKSKPFLFGIGTDFNKIKAPFVWYNIIHYLDTLTSFPYLKNNKELHSIVDNFEKSKKNEDGKYVPESIYKAWSSFCFGQKSLPSPWLTLIIYRIKKRLGMLEFETNSIR
jgi:hypothetical protein